MNRSENKLKGVKVVRVSTVAFFVETQLHTQIYNIVQAGAQVTVVASEAALEHEIPGSRYVSIEIPRKIEILKDLSALLKLWLFFRRSNFHIVHSTTPKAGLLCCLAAKLAGVPVRLHTFTGQPWIGLTGVERFLSKASDKLIARLNTHCYADSSSQKEFIVKSGIASLGRIRVLGSGSLAGVNFERFNPLRFSERDKDTLKIQLSITPSASVLLFVGRLSREKGLAELLAAFQKIIAENIEVFLILLGPPEADIESLLDGLSDAAKAKIILPGFSSEPEQFMAIADILLLPSYREGFGTVVIEAAAMGVPAIGTNIYGLTDAIVDGKTGLLVPVKCVDELAAAIKTVLNDSSMRLEMSRNARERVENEFSSLRVSGLVIDEYVDLLRASKRLQ
jgi:glycosyltransferase involved in cell wall biosynthesis